MFVSFEILSLKSIQKIIIFGFLLLRAKEILQLIKNAILFLCQSFTEDIKCSLRLFIDIKNSLIGLLDKLRLFFIFGKIGIDWANRKEASDRKKVHELYDFPLL
jgi:hypothetical protein